MRLIDADKLMELYANTSDCSIDDCRVSIPVIRQNILDMPTVNPYEWISVEDRLPKENQLVLCYRYYHDMDLCKLEQPFTHYNDNKYYWYSFNDNDWDCVQDKDYWMPLPTPPEEKEA